jgi:hypothetical protein
MNLSFTINPNITFYRGEDEYYKYSSRKLNSKLLDSMIKDIASKKFRDWYSKELNQNVSQDSGNIDNYLNFKITKIIYIGKFLFKCHAKLSINYNGKFNKISKDKVDKLIKLKNIKDYLKSSSSHYYRSADTYRGVINSNNREKSNLYGLYQGAYFLQNNKIVKKVNENKPFESCDFVIMEKDIKNISLV